MLYLYPSPVKISGAENATVPVYVHISIFSSSDKSPNSLYESLNLLTLKSVTLIYFLSS